MDGLEQIVRNGVPFHWEPLISQATGAYYRPRGSSGNGEPDNALWLSERLRTATSPASPRNCLYSQSPDWTTRGFDALSVPYELLIPLSYSTR